MSLYDIPIVLVIIGIGVLFFLVIEMLGLINTISTKDVMDFGRDVTAGKKKQKKQPDIEGEKTFIGRNPNKKDVFIPNNAKHVFVCGTTGSGKTVALSNFIKSGIVNDYPMLIIDGKGDIGNNSILDIVNALKENKKVYIINLNNPETSDKYNPFKNTSPTKIKDMLMSMTEWSEDFYKLNVDRYLQRLISLLRKAKIEISFKSIVENMSAENFLLLSASLEKDGIIKKQDNISNIEMIENSGKAVEGSYARFSTIFESELGTIFDETGIDILTAIKEKAIILFILNPLTYPEISPLIGNLIILDSKKAVSGLFGGEIKRTFFIFDEINVYASKQLLNLVNKSRSANVTSILATQSLSDLDEAAGIYFKEQIIENCNNYLILRQNSDINAEKFSAIIGTRNSMDITYQIKSDKNITSDTGLGSMRNTREFLYHPDDIKNLKTGEAIFVSKDNGYNSKVIINKPV